MINCLIVYIDSVYQIFGVVTNSRKANKLRNVNPVKCHVDILKKRKPNNYKVSLWLRKEAVFAACGNYILITFKYQI